MNAGPPLPALVTARLPQLLDWDESTFAAHFDHLSALADDLGQAVGVGAAAAALAAQEDEQLRALGFDLLAAGIPRDRTLVDTLVRLATIAGTAGGDDLRWSVTQALASIEDTRSADLLAGFAHDADGDVRWQVAFGLPAQGCSAVVSAAWDLLLGMTMMTFGSRHG